MNKKIFAYPDRPVIYSKDEVYRWKYSLAKGEPKKSMWAFKEDIRKFLQRKYPWASIEISTAPETRRIL